MAQIATEYQDIVTDTPTDPEYEAWFCRKVAKSIQTVETGHLLSSEEINQRSESRIQRILAEHAETV